MKVKFKGERIDLVLNDVPTFVIDLEMDREYSIIFQVYAVTSWMDDNPKEVELEEYVHGYMKWDGCNHFNFGEGGHGYLHLCGGNNIDEHIYLMNYLQNLARKEIVRYDGE